MKIVLLNGPAGSGKDTIANSLHALVDAKCETVKFAAPLKSIAMHVFCEGNSKTFYDIDNDQQKKNEPNELFFGKSCRQAQIDISEIYLKQAYDEKIFGRILSKTIEKKAAEGTEVFFVSDSGFKPEAQVLADIFEPYNVLLIRLHREGHGYQKDPSLPGYDSRDYVNLDEEGVQSHDVENITGDINTTLKEVADIVNNFIKESN